jgi:hypothetical protein
LLPCRHRGQARHPSCSSQPGADPQGFIDRSLGVAGSRGPDQLLLPWFLTVRTPRTTTELQSWLVRAAALLFRPVPELSAEFFRRLQEARLPRRTCLQERWGLRGQYASSGRDNDHVFRARARRFRRLEIRQAEALQHTVYGHCNTVYRAAEPSFVRWQPLTFVPRMQRSHKITIIYMLKRLEEGCRGSLSLSRPRQGGAGARSVVPVAEMVCGRHALRGLVADLNHQDIRTSLLRTVPGNSRAGLAPCAAAVPCAMTGHR